MKVRWKKITERRNDLKIGENHKKDEEETMVKMEKEEKTVKMENEENGEDEK